MDTSGYTPYVIEPQEIISEDHVEEEGDVITSVDVTTSMHMYVQGGELKYYGRFTNYALVQKYGFRNKQVSMPYLTSNSAAYLFAQNILARHNADALHTASITIVGRPEIRPGFPIYLPHKDMFYYVTDVSHNFTWGEDFSTTLTLRAGRRRLYTLPISGNEDFEKGIKLTGEPKKNMYMALVEKSNQQKSQESSQVPKKPSDEDPKEYRASLITDHGTWVYLNGSELLKKKSGYSPVSISNVTVDVRQVIPVSDEYGFELVGTFPYGRYLYLDSTGQVIHSPLIEKRDSANKLNNADNFSVRGGTISNPSAGTALLNSLDTGNSSEDSIQTIDPKIKDFVPLHPGAEGAITSSDVLSDEEKIVQLASMRPDDSNDVCFCDCHYTQPEIDKATSPVKNETTTEKNRRTAITNSVSTNK